MARVLDRQRAIELRKQGKTYSEIKKLLGISKSTLSDWLSNYPLTADQLRILKSSQYRNKEISIEKTIIAKKRKRELRLENTYKEMQQKLLPLSDKELLIAGLFLYWGEGVKNIQGQISLNNTDPQVLKFILFWMTSILRIPKDKLRVLIHLYNDMDINKEVQYWSKELQIPTSQFIKPYIKHSTRKNIFHKGFGHGTCGIFISNVRLKEKIIMGIKTIADYYSDKISGVV